MTNHLTWIIKIVSNWPFISSDYRFQMNRVHDHLFKYNWVSTELFYFDHWSYLNWSIKKNPTQFIKTSFSPSSLQCQYWMNKKKGVDAYLRTPPVYISRKWVLFKGKKYRCFDKVVTREYCFSPPSHFIWSSRLLIFWLSQHEVSCSFAWK